MRLYLEINKQYLLLRANFRLKKKVKHHNKGNTHHTKKYRPVTLVYYSAFISKPRALQFEKYLKVALEKHSRKSD
jgi:predicted GIY-YIG superfamily endonuclease